MPVRMVLGGVRLLRFTRSRGLQCSILRAWAQGEQMPGRAGTAWLEGAYLAMRAGEAGPHHDSPPTLVGGPALARMAGRTGRDLAVPVKPDVLEGEGIRRSGLRLLVFGCWSHEHHAMVA